MINLDGDRVGIQPGGGLHGDGVRPLELRVHGDHAVGESGLAR